MTLNIHFTCHKFAIAISDRMVTANRAKFDTQSNKTIVTVVEDAAVTISYTGTAYIGVLPTDVWLARLIMADADRYLKVNAITYQYKFLPRLLRNLMSRIVVGLKNEITTNFQFRKEYLEIGISGHSIERLYINPYQVIIQKQARSSCMQFSKGHQATKYEEMPFYVWVSGGWPYAKPKIHSEMMSALRSVDMYRDPDAQSKVTDILYAALQKYAENEPTISTDCMLVIHDVSAMKSKIEFKSLSEYVQNDIGSILCQIIEIRYSPWILGGKTVLPPLEISANMNLTLGGYPILLKGAAETIGKSKVFFIGPQSRPKRM